MGQRKLRAHARGNRWICYQLQNAKIFQSHLYTIREFTVARGAAKCVDKSVVQGLFGFDLILSFQFDSSLGTCNFFGDPKKGQVSRWRAVAVLLFYCSRS